MTTYPVKQGGLAAQQADIIAQTIVADVRTGTPPPPERTLQVRLLGGRRPVELHAVLDADGRAVDARLESTPPDAPVAAAAPESKVFGRYLTSYLASRAPADAGTW